MERLGRRARFVAAGLAALGATRWWRRSSSRSSTENAMLAIASRTDPAGVSAAALASPMCAIISVGVAIAIRPSSEMMRPSQEDTA